MKKFIVTSAGFSGEVHIVYGTDGVLMLLDYSHAELDAKQVDWLKAHTPVTYSKDTFLSHYNTDKLTFVEAGYQVTFEMFWVKYDKKINKTTRCQPLWDKLSQTNKVKAYHGITPYFAYLARTGFRDKKDPENYLKYKMWETDWTKER